MLLLSRILDHDDGSTCCEVDLSNRDFIRQEDGALPPWICIEYMAQCVAAHEALRAAAAGRPFQSGLLMGARHVHFSRTRLPGQGRAEVAVRYLSGRVGLGVLSYAGEVREPSAVADQSLWAEGILSVALMDLAAQSPGSAWATRFGEDD
jgi:predicted hotdog family 3-hydroxylacyl-ACP dehydratase